MDPPLDRFMKRFRSKDKLTHLSLIGGKFCVPGSKFPNLYRVYANCHKNAFLVERTLFPFKFFMDIDETRVETVQHDLVRDFPKDEYMVLVNDTNDGVHVVFQNLIVHDTATLDMILKRTTMDLDRSVYRSGLRMVGSRKKLDVSRVYRVFSVNRKRVDDHQPLTPELVRMASIHTPDSVPAPVIKSAPPGSKDPLTRATEYVYNRDLAKLEFTKVEPIPGDLAKVLTTSRFCENIGREHRSNHVYFILNMRKKELRQRCFCTCVKPELAVMCKDYESKPIKIPIKLYLSLEKALRGL